MRPLWRLLAGSSAAYLLAFGLLSVIATAGQPFFHDGDARMLGLRTNPALAWLCVALGAVGLAGTVIGRTAAMAVHLGVGAVCLLGGLATLAVLQTSVNKLNLDMATCIASFVTGTILLAAGLYGRTGTPREAVTEEVLRHSTRPGDKFAVEPHANP
ncbi:DUF4383 domain-containing protein [Catellatospora sichuanensis]|uniref:DUF4383 domain-containing protein n=1 Tax=Catellatospora sichuanensis TaxID=1969805 RepID=UPI0016427E10|nr:DUF4383 domain-containing protein [Catellatospora sichuanensis]